MEWLKALYVAATIFGAGVTIADLVGAFSNLGEGDGDGEAGDDAEGDDTDDDGSAGGSILAHDRKHRKSPIIALLSLLRTTVYFALGFGPVGWFATTQYETAAATLAWSLPVGLFVAAGTRAFRSFMRRDLSSEVTREDLLMERGTVTVSIGAGEIGKVRVVVGGAYTERFARSQGREAIPVGAVVRVVDSDDELVFVEPEE